MSDTQQRLWDVLRRAGQTLGVGELAGRARASEVYARRYVATLAAAGYLEDKGPGTQGRAWTLCRDTGPKAPRLRKRGTEIVGLWDPNLDPPMPAAELAAIRAAAGLTLARFAEALGWSPTSAIHVRRMEAGTKPISPEIAAKARAIRSGR